MDFLFLLSRAAAPAGDEVLKNGKIFPFIRHPKPHQKHFGNFDLIWMKLRRDHPNHLSTPIPSWTPVLRFCYDKGVVSHVDVVVFHVDVLKLMLMNDDLNQPYYTHLNFFFFLSLSPDDAEASPLDGEEGV